MTVFSKRELKTQSWVAVVFYGLLNINDNDSKAI